MCTENSGMVHKKFNISWLADWEGSRLLFSPFYTILMFYCANVLLFSFKNKELGKNKISIHGQWYWKVWQGLRERNTIKMDAKSLTSPSGPRADSPPSAFSSAFCKTTMCQTLPVSPEDGYRKNFMVTLEYVTAFH